MSVSMSVNCTPVFARTAMIDGYFNLPEPTIDAMKEIRAAFAECAKKVQHVTLGAGAFDIGRLIACIDLIQQAKNVACDSLILPHYKPPSVTP